MGILAPLALIALPLLGLILALYLLRLRRPMSPVASLILWDSLTRDREANTLWQRLRVSVLLALQLLALLALILAMARPWVSSEQPVGRNTIVVIDVSASMGTADGSSRGGQTRLEAAKDRANGIVDSLPQDGTAAIIESGLHASVIVPPTSDKARLRAAIGRLEPLAVGTDMLEAMKLASALSARQNEGTVWVLSDGAFTPVTNAVGAIRGELHYVQIGHGRDNAGITALSLRQDAGNMQLFAQLVNSADVTVTRRLDLSVDDQPWAAREVLIAPGATKELVVDDVPLQARVVQAQIAEQDTLDVDNHAWVVNRASAPGTMLLVTQGNTFLKLALSLLPTVELWQGTPADYRTGASLNGAPPDVTVFDGVVPADLSKSLPPGNILIFAPPATNGLVTVSGVITEPVPSLASGPQQAPQGARDNSQVGVDPLLRYVDMSSLHVAKAQLMELPSWGRVVLGSDKGPLIIAGEMDNHKICVVGFDIHDSDLALQTAFPLLIRNLVTYLLPGPAGGLPAEVQPSSTVSIEGVTPAVDRVVVEDPSAKEWTFALTTTERRFVFGETAQPGVYYVSQYAGADLVGQEAFAVNLLSRDESVIIPDPAPGLPAATGVARAAGAESGARDDAFRREVWPLVAMAGLLILLAEWAYAQRMVIRRAITEWRARRKAERALRAD